MHEQIPPLPSHRPNGTAPTRLPFWKRFLFSTLIPDGVVAACVYLYLKSIPSLKNPPGGGGGGVGDIVVLMVVAALGFALFVVPIAICTLLAAFRPWRRWYTALAGGFAAVGVGILIGGAVILILKLASE